MRGLISEKKTEGSVKIIKPVKAKVRNWRANQRYHGIGEAENVGGGFYKNQGECILRLIEVQRYNWRDTGLTNDGLREKVIGWGQCQNSVAQYQMVWPIVPIIFYTIIIIFSCVALLLIFSIHSGQTLRHLFNYLSFALMRS